jgi:hypothetical protein
MTVFGPVSEGGRGGHTSPLFDFLVDIVGSNECLKKQMQIRRGGFRMTAFWGSRSQFSGQILRLH